jgi:hypothetical protein
MKNLLNKLSLVTILSVAGQSTFTSDRWNNEVVELAPSFIADMPNFIEMMKEDLGDDDFGYNSLGLASALGCMVMQYNDWFGDVSDTESNYSKIRQNGYELVIQYFIDHGCDINQNVDVVKLLQGADAADLFETNRFKSLLTVALMFNDKAITRALLNKGATLDATEQLDA